MQIALRALLLFMYFLILSFVFKLVFLYKNDVLFVNDSLISILSSMRFDIQIYAYCFSVFYIFALINKYLANAFYYVLSFVCLAINLAFFVYFNIYHQNFGVELFLFKNEEIFALIKSGLKSNYGVVSSIILFFILMIVNIYILNSVNKIKIKTSVLKNILSFIFYAFFMMFCINQQFSFKADFIQRRIIASENEIVNISVFGHFIGFINAIEQIRKQTNIDWDSFKLDSPKKVACEFFNINPCTGKIDLKKYLHKVKQDDEYFKAQKIYYIISESLSDWVMQDRFNDIFTDIHTLAKEGAYISALHNAPATKQSLEVQILNTYNTTDDTAAKYAKIKKHFFSLNDNLKNLHLSSAFFMGGYDNWGDIANLTRLSNFNANFYAPQIRAVFKDDSINSEWGVFDDVLFKYVALKDYDFNVIMSTTNHPTYNLEFQKRKLFSLPFEKAEKLSKKYKNELLTIYWYQKVLVDFIKEQSNKYPDALFVITGDHYGRYNIDDSLDLKITHTVPIIMYSKNHKIYPICKITKHIDIGASIINLIAPKNYEYYSFGIPCFSLKEQDVKSYEQIGFNASFKNDKFINDELRQKQAQALSWYLIFKGNIIE